MAEIIETEDANKKGADFEILFAEFMKSDLKWEGYAIRTQQKQKSNNSGVQVDIIAKRTDDRGKKFYKVCLAYLIFGIAMIVIATILYAADFYELCQYPAIIGMVFAIGSAVALWLSKKFNQENAWVECKRRKDKATIEQVHKLLYEFNDYIATGDKEYKYVEKYFVSEIGFVDNALKLALDNKIVCYEYKDGKFIKKDYWK